MASNVFPMLSASPPPMDDCADDDDEDDEFGNFTSASIAFNSFNSPVSVDKSNKFKPGDNGINSTNFSEMKGMNSFSNSSTPSPLEFIPNFSDEMDLTKNGFIPIKIKTPKVLQRSDLDFKNSSFCKQFNVSSQKDTLDLDPSNDTEESKVIQAVNKISFNSSVPNNVKIIPEKLTGSEVKFIPDSTEIEEESKNYNIAAMQGIPSTKIFHENYIHDDTELEVKSFDGGKSSTTEYVCDFNSVIKKDSYKSPQALHKNFTDTKISNLDSFTFTDIQDNTEQFSDDEFEDFHACDTNWTNIENSVEFKSKGDKKLISSDNKLDNIQGCDLKTSIQISENGVKISSVDDFQDSSTLNAESEEFTDFEDSNNLKDESIAITNFQYSIDTTAEVDEFSDFQKSVSIKLESEKSVDLRLSNNFNIKNDEFSNFQNISNQEDETQKFAVFQNYSDLKNEPEEFNDFQNSSNLKNETEEFADFQDSSKLKNAPEEFAAFLNSSSSKNEPGEFTDLQATSNTKNVSEEFSDFQDFSSIKNESVEIIDFQHSSDSKYKSKKFPCLQLAQCKSNEVDFDCIDNARGDFDDRFTDSLHLTDPDLKNFGTVKFESSKNEEFDEFADFQDFQEPDDDDDFAEFSAVPFRSNKASETSESSEFANFEETSVAPPSSYFQDSSSQKSVDTLSTVLQTIFPYSEDPAEEVVTEELPAQILEQSNKSRRLWEKLHEVEQTPSLRFQWGVSHSFQQLLRSVNVDYYSILRTSFVPIFASGLSLLEPMKGLSNSANSHESEDRNQVPKDPIPPVNFDWNSSGLVNPLDSQAASTLMDLSFLSSVDTQSSATHNDHSFENELLKPSPALLCPENSSKTQILEQLLSKNVSSVPNSSLSYQRSSDLSSEAVRVLDQLPDLSYMQAKVLMFPISSKT